MKLKLVLCIGLLGLQCFTAREALATTNSTIFEVTTNNISVTKETGWKQTRIHQYLFFSEKGMRLPFQAMMEFDSAPSFPGTKYGNDFFFFGFCQPFRQSRMGWFVSCDYPLSSIGPYRDTYETGFALRWSIGKMRPAK
jgi:hypothetical protein